MLGHPEAVTLLLLPCSPPKHSRPPLSVYNKDEIATKEPKEHVGPLHSPSVGNLLPTQLRHERQQAIKFNQSQHRRQSPTFNASIAILIHVCRSLQTSSSLVEDEQCRPLRSCTAIYAGYHRATGCLVPYPQLTVRKNRDMRGSGVLIAQYSPLTRLEPCI